VSNWRAHSPSSIKALRPVGPRPAVSTPILAQAQTAQKPNLLFILVDNLGYGELGAYGGGATRGAHSAHVKVVGHTGSISPADRREMMTA
jgi:hypothetical protein